MEITRSGILRDVLEEKNREMHRYSRHEAGLLPLEGYEKHFEDLKQTCELLRGMIRNAEERERETRLAGWQMDVIRADCRGEHPGMSWADKEAPPNMAWNADSQQWEPMRTPEEVLRRRRRNQEDFRPAPVVYPGGEDDGTV